MEIYSWDLLSDFPTLVICFGSDCIWPRKRAEADDDPHLAGLNRDTSPVFYPLNDELRK
jgi:hypothetical protein